MKKLITLLLLVASTFSYSQKTSNFFVTVDYSKEAGASVFYNHILGESKIGMGAGLQVFSFKNFSDQKPFSALAEIRYYFTLEKSAVIPFIQSGYNFYKNEIDVSGLKYTKKGGPQSNLGIGYSYELLENGGGIYAAIGMRMMVFPVEGENAPSTSSRENQFLFSVGFRF